MESLRLRQSAGLKSAAETLQEAIRKSKEKNMEELALNRLLVEHYQDPTREQTRAGQSREIRLQAMEANFLEKNSNYTRPAINSDDFKLKHEMVLRLELDEAAEKLQSALIEFKRLGEKKKKEDSK